MNRNYTYIDLFAGCGGLSLGLRNAGWKGLFAIEKSPDAFATLEYNLINNKKHFIWPGWLPQSAHDINEVIANHAAELTGLQGSVDLVAGGPPCQGFSFAGRRREEDVRNGLVNSYLKFVGLVKPKLIFFENVKGFTMQFEKNRSDGKVYADYVVNELEQDYQVHGELLDFAKYGIPQKRTRFILVGVQKVIAGENESLAKSFFNLLLEQVPGFCKRKGLPRKPKLASAISDLLKANGTIPTPDRGKKFQSGLYAMPTSNYQRYLRKGVTTDVPNSHSFANHKAHITKRFGELIKIGGTSKNITDAQRKELGTSKHVIIPLSPVRPAPTLTTLPDDCIHYAEPRILTVREYARIQSFPDWYEFQKKYTTGGENRVKEVPRYTQVGNAIPPLFGEQGGLVLKQLLG